jgi:TOBE domain
LGTFYLPNISINAITDVGQMKRAQPTGSQAEVVHKAFRGAEIFYTLKLPSGAKVLSLVPSHHNHEIGQKIGIKLEIDHVVAFPMA